MLQSALKFDGHLVVNSSFETNIEYVYAAGTMARFMHNDSVIISNHIHYNRLEIGIRLANVLMKRLGIIENDKSNDPYVQPIFVYCQLPGKYYYMHTEVPVWRSLKTYTRSLSTGNITDGYFEIVVNTYGDVMALSCYSKKVSTCRNTYISLGISISLYLFNTHVIYLFILAHFVEF